MKKLTLFAESPGDFSAVPASVLKQAWIETNLPDLHQCLWGCGLDRAPDYHVSHCEYMQVDWSTVVAVANRVLTDHSVRRADGWMEPEKVRQRAKSLARGRVGEAATSLLTDAIRVMVTGSSLILNNGRHRVAAMLAQSHSSLDVPVIKM